MKRIILAIIAGIAILFVFIGLLLLVVAGIKAFNRSQARLNAHNSVSITKIQIENQKKYAEVIYAENQSVKAKAEQRYLEAVGIRRAQDEISKTLTPLYIQHEAIEAEKAVATSGQNNTLIYIPSGNNGVPLVSPIGTGTKIGR